MSNGTHQRLAYGTDRHAAAVLLLWTDLVNTSTLRRSYHDGSAKLTCKTARSRARRAERYVSPGSVRKVTVLHAAATLPVARPVSSDSPLGFIPPSTLHTFVFREFVVDVHSQASPSPLRTDVCSKDI